LSCEKCPINKVSAIGSKSIDDCVCAIGFYKNPSNPKDCLPCPTGAICSEKNLTIPIAQPGFWFSNEDINSFYVCYPKISCAGGQERNCSKLKIF
jgi:hypothetical protein